MADYSFADVIRYQRQVKEKGRLASWGTAIAQKTVEALDPRNALFERFGPLATTFESLKGYQAKGKRPYERSSGRPKPKTETTEDTTKPTKKTPEKGVTTGSLSVNTKLLAIIKSNNIIVKNTSYLPQIAKDINVIKHGIIKISGLKSAKHIEDFYSEAKANEEKYESEISESTPTPVPADNQTEDKNKNGLGGILFFILGPFIKLIGSIKNSLKPLLTILETITLSLAKFLGPLIGSVGILNNLRNTLRTVTIGSIIKNLFGKILKSKKLKLLAAILAGGAGALFSGKTEAGEIESGGLEDITGEKPETNGNDITPEFPTEAIGAGALATMSMKSLFKSRTTLPTTPTTKWTRFIEFLKNKSPRLFAKVGQRLLLVGAGFTVPVVGWIWSLINIIGNVFLAWEVYNLWLEFTGEDTGPEITSPTRAYTQYDETQPYEPTRIVQQGITPQQEVVTPQSFDKFNETQLNAYTKAIVGIEKGKYGEMGGAGKKYAGKYQMGQDAIIDAAKFLNIPVPTTEEFLSNPALQDRMFAAFTQSNHRMLMQSPLYREKTPEEQLGILGYAHNQGAGGAKKWLTTGIVGYDANKTPGTQFQQDVLKNLAAAKATPISPTQISPTPNIPLESAQFSSKRYQKELNATNITGVFGEQRRDHLHSGLDFSAPLGTPVKLPNGFPPGTVEKIGSEGDYGNNVIIDHGNGIKTRYAHLSSIDVKQGENVNNNTIIGKVGSTGSSTGNHLHFEIMENGKTVNPETFSFVGKISPTNIVGAPMEPEVNFGTTPQLASPTPVASSLSQNVLATKQEEYNMVARGFLDRLVGNPRVQEFMKDFDPTSLYEKAFSGLNLEADSKDIIQDLTKASSTVIVPTQQNTTQLQNSQSDTEIPSIVHDAFYQIVLKNLRLDMFPNV